MLDFSLGTPDETPSCRTGIEARQLRDGRAMTICDTKTVVDWLAAGARSGAASGDVLAELCDRFLACGIDLSRVGLFVHTLHPEIMGQRFLWRAGQPVAVGNLSFEDSQSDTTRLSPVSRVTATGTAVRRRLAARDCPIDFAVLRELRGEGATDYLASPLVFADGARHVVTWTTRRPDGFTEAEIRGIEATIDPLARVVENRTLRQKTVDLLNIYVGNQAGSRVLAGQVRRGDTEAINAAIWLSDMRGFTALADRLPPRTLIDLLNRYFDCQVPAIVERGGEILKFMGDGLLAIFPIDGDAADTERVCAAVVAAACEARATVAAMPRPAGEIDAGGLRFGLALHLGEILYGNIGSGNRLDFTCIGPAVNVAARIEKLAGKLGRTILASQEFARHCPSDFVPLGEFALAGLSAEQMVFGLEDEGECSSDAAPR
ncbi:MAG: putative Adenylate/Guanylate cyclase [Rhodospirillales bacterium]|nr:putative Adenylate/Guanylate cyclase [Rhodospirillales bacterium]